MEDYLEEKPIDVARLKARHPQGDARHLDDPGARAARASRTRACSRCSTRSSTTCRARSTSRRSRALEPDTRRAPRARPRSSRAPTTTSRSRRWPSRSCPTRSSASSPTSASTPASSQAGGRVLNATTGRTERVGRILMMHANDREEQDEVYAGDIAAGVGLKQTSTGDTLCAPDAPILLETIDVPGAGRARLDRAEDQGRPGEDGASRSAASPRRTRPSRSAPTRRPARPSSPAWASCTSRCSSTA